ncbi:MAG: efflux RND transporter permease subunit [Paludibacter sp.]|nr:efflux RND transporter permease subunit [Paludibacter sp.]
MSLYESSVRKPVMTSIIFIAVVILGLFSYNKLPIDLMPKIESNSIMVMTTYEGASASDVETNVTRPLESSLNAVSNLKNITSTSKENRSIITMEFEYGLDLNVVTNDIRNKLDLVKSYMPAGAGNPIIFKLSTDMIPVIMLSATAGQSLPALYKILDTKVSNPLARINGVGSVSIMGAPQREIQVYVDPVKLEAYHLTIEALAQFIRMENVNTPAGSMDVGSDTYALRVQGEFKDPSEMNNIVVGNFNGKTVKLSDVAVIIDKHEERMQESYTNGKQGAAIIIQKQSGANTVQIAKDVLKMLPQIKKSLPSDVKLSVIGDTSDNILRTVDSLAETVIYALLFVMLVVLFFLGRWRATVIIILTIPISLIAAFIYLALTGGTLNVISLSSLSLAIGLVVDDAIVVLENITTHIERGSRPKTAAVNGTNEVGLSIIASTLTIIAVFLPLTMVSGMAGVMFSQLGWMVTIIITVSMICALTLTPMLASQLLRMDPKRSKGFNAVYGPIERFLDKLDERYAQLVNWAVRHKKTILASATLFFIVSIIPLIVGWVGTENFPAQDSGVVSATIELPIGTRMEITKAVCQKLHSTWGKKYPEIDMVNYSVGQASSKNIFGSLFSKNSSNVGTFSVRLVNLKDRKRSAFAITDSIRNDIKRMPEIRKSTVIAGGGMSMMGGQSTLDVEIYGYDFAQTDKVAAEVSKRLAKVHGLVNTTVSREEYTPEYQVDFDREKLALNGLNISTASNYLSNRINGITSSLYREDGEEYSIVVAYAPEYRQSVEAIENILIYNVQGQAIRLKDLGKVVERFTPPTIERKNRQRIITVSSTVSGTTLDKAVKDINVQLAKIDIPSDVTTKIAGSFKDQQESFGDLGTLLMIIILLVFVVMASQFESVTYPFIIMFSVPFGISGVVLALWLTGTTFNVMTFVGVIMLVGIVVKNGIVMVDYINLNRERGMGIIRAVVTGGKSRLRPVLMTSLTAILGMLPLAISRGQGSEMWKPMAVTVIGGLTVSTMLTLVVVPTIYTLFAASGVKRQHKKLKRIAREKRMNELSANN